MINRSSISSVERREVLLGAAAAAASGCIRLQNDQQLAFRAAIQELTEHGKTQIGVMALNTADGATLGFAEDRRFTMASTFKFSLAAHVLREIDRGRLSLTERLALSETDMVAHAPVSERFLETGSMTINQLCAAAVIYSDNPAANVLLRATGGPEGLTQFWQSIGDSTSRLDHFELALNQIRPNDQRDTTTARAMVTTMRRILLGSVLSRASRDRLTDWLVAAKTGDKRLCGGMPSGWRCGNKTGTTPHRLVNDLAIAWPDGASAPVLIALYVASEQRVMTDLETLHRGIARRVLSGFSLV